MLTVAEETHAFEQQLPLRHVLSEQQHERHTLCGRDATLHLSNCV